MQGKRPTWGRSNQEGRLYVSAEEQQVTSGRHGNFIRMITLTKPTLIMQVQPESAFYCIGLEALLS